MKVAHYSTFGGHLRIKKTKSQIQTNFCWPRMQSNATSFCRSCNVCQKAAAKGFVSSVPPGDMPLIDLPFSRVAVDLIRPISLAGKGHKIS